MVSVSKQREEATAAGNAKCDEAAVSERRFDSDEGGTDAAEEKLKVVVRVRPLQKGEEPWPKAADIEPRGSDSALPTALSIQENQILWEKNGQIKVLTADAVFADAASQGDVFHSVADCVDGLFAGFDCSVFAYGQTGTGKTYTMCGLQHGDSTDNFTSIPDSFGIVPRSITSLFTQMEREKSATNGTSFAVYCSFIEIYNEKISDMLAPDDSRVGKITRLTESKRQAFAGSLTHRAVWNCAVSSKEAGGLQIRQKLDGSVFVDGMTSRNVTTKEELFQAFQEGSANRETRNNFFNQHSSRGHSVFQITLRRNIVDENHRSSRDAPNDKISHRSNQSRLSRLFFVDLAGSEKWHMNGSDLSERYASELSSINKSLSALTNCVLALTQKSRSHIPFRDSILTRLLQSCLQGAGRTSFIVTISPAKESLEESFATLRFVERLKALRCRPIRRSMFSSDALGEQRLYYERQIQNMRVEVNRLRVLLKKVSEKPRETTESPSAGDANTALVEENRRLKELLMKAEKSGLLDRAGNGTLSSEKLLNTFDSETGAFGHRFSSRNVVEPTSRPDRDSGTTASERLPKQQKHKATSPPRASIHAAGSEQGDDNMEREGPRDHLTTLETQLRSKEARLNWMLEAEIEAQNAGADVVDIDAATSTPSEPSIPTKSWAAETRLRRKLVGVPVPLRQAQQADARDNTDPRRPLLPSTAVAQSRTGTLKPKEIVPYIRPQPVLRKNSPANARSSNPMLEFESSHSKHRRTPSPPIKVDSLRDPTYQTAKTGTESRRRRMEVALTPQPPGRSNPPQPQASNSRRNEKTEPEPAKSAAILKLVGSGSAVGKTREELVEEYKRARRAELEAMMRTMMLQK